MTGARADRRELLRMLGRLAPGDVVTVTRIDRLARSTFDLLPGYTYTKWWHDFIGETDCLLFPLFKLHFISPVSNGSNSTMPNCLAAIGRKGTEALHRAAETGFGRLFGLG